MNFIEAVTALKEGRCEGIKRTGWYTPHLQIDNSAATSFRWADGGRNAFSLCDYLADDWQLVNERPQVEEVEAAPLFRVINPVSGKNYSLEHTLKRGEEVAKRHGFVCVPLTGTYTRPIPPKKKRRELVGTAESTLSSHYYDFMRDTNKMPSGAKIFAEWQE